MHWLAQAPSNIALIKYMGKKEGTANWPDNSSLSYTLNNLLTTVRIEPSSDNLDHWEPLIQSGSSELNLSTNAQNRYLSHLQRIKNHFDYQGGFLVRSANNFPHSSGLASSASSFAALTLCASRALSELTGQPIPSINEQAQLSRQGSGSSCRSFYSPWVLWSEDQVTAIKLPYDELIHQVIVINKEEKEVSSSEAHQRVKSSLLYQTRNQRAEDNLTQLLEALNQKQWAKSYEICWREFQDMHHLFNTCKQPFSYIDDHSLNALHILQRFWDQKGDGPIVTMDAGPNIHLLYRSDQYEMAAQIKQDYLMGHYDVL